ncbi:MAG: endopeptidase La [Oscillospiraceae bacterium]|nr:endopeptidase La [Oscillospiraceae bacterium]
MPAAKGTKKHILPLLPLRGITVYPYMTMPFEVGRKKSVSALEECMVGGQLIMLVTQVDARDENPGQGELYPYGTIAKVNQLLKLPEDNVRVLVEGQRRAKLERILKTSPYLIVEASEDAGSGRGLSAVRAEAIRRTLISHFEDYTRQSPKAQPDMLTYVSNVEDLDQLIYVIASSVSLHMEQKQRILSEESLTKRGQLLISLMAGEVKVAEIEKDIGLKVRQQLEKNHKDYYLREQIKVIQGELGDRESAETEADSYKEKLGALTLPEETERKVGKEIDRLSRMSPGSPEATVIRTYLDVFFELPWNVSTEETLDPEAAMRRLDEDHYGLVKVKERIVEYLAVRKLTNSLKGPIICLIGPPGVGKTSIAMSVAASLNRKYVRVALGGVRDEAEIRGHRKTYIGSMAGRIIAALKQAGTNNPLILLDEIDKLCGDFRGDPASALLEVLDGEQNNTFRDHYLEVPFDLSQVLFMTTANTPDPIPKALYDRMEPITITSYTDEEKLSIAQRYLLPKQIARHGLSPRRIRFDGKAISHVITHYTRESGVRSLERELSSVIRKAARAMASDENKKVRITESGVRRYLGPIRFRTDAPPDTEEVGLVTGLAWTSVGGDTLSIEVSVVDGTGKVELTGHLGEVMKESAKAAISYIRSRSRELGIDPRFHQNKDMHLHVPAGATPKDGPSAGISIASAMVSALTGIPIRRGMAMTGELTLRGKVMPIGGVKEKVLAADRAGIRTVVMPAENDCDLEEIPAAVMARMRFAFVRDMDAVLTHSLSRPPVPAAQPDVPEAPEAPPLGAIAGAPAEIRM